DKDRVSDSGAIRSRLVPQFKHRGSHSLSRGLARMPYLAALYLRWLSAKIAWSLGYFIGPSRRCRRCECRGVYFRRSRVAWRDRPCGQRRRRLSSRPALPSFTADALAWNLETDDLEAP